MSVIYKKVLRENPIRRNEKKDYPKLVILAKA